MEKSSGSWTRQQVLSLHPQSTILKGEIDILDFIKMKNFCFRKNLRGRNWDLFANHISDQSRTYNSKNKQSSCKRCEWAKWISLKRING